MVIEIITGSIFALIAVVALVQPRATLKCGKVRYTCKSKEHQTHVKTSVVRKLNSAEMELIRQLDILATNVRETERLAGIDTSKDRRQIGRKDRRHDGAGNRRKV